MFMADDRDRFGRQRYPRVLPQNPPGPGAYQVENDSLQARVNGLHLKI
jgi:hypothetical protein